MLASSCVSLASLAVSMASLASALAFGKSSDATPSALAFSSPASSA
ncbi:hypothetical protein H1220_02345 [Carnobacteriaceae bacterium zg-84]|nr:hypothetical protein H1220_02345 [Carnobacteriaceae bacterium zg-84]